MFRGGFGWVVWGRTNDARIVGCGHAGDEGLAALKVVSEIPHRFKQFLFDDTLVYRFL